MKKLKITMAVLFSLLLSAGIAVLSLSIWANQPRGVRIDLDSLKDM